ncbi:MAG TPA: hypothetical protein VEW25_08610 [Allosphingosinicella sp.]|nr:hypothetical protein [Allosphingosinicella sp.]
MHALQLIAPALLAVLAAPAALADPIAAHGEQEEMRRIDRQEIARILAADNVDATRLPAIDVAAAVRHIPRGEAPDDFWTAYQAHVRAWERSAAAEERLQRLAEGKPVPLEEIFTELLAAEAAVGETFDAVRRIAEAYGVPMPTPPAEAAETI